MKATKGGFERKDEGVLEKRRNESDADAGVL